MSDLKKRHFLLSVMIPVNNENHIKNYHYVIPENTTLPDMRNIRHNVRNSLRPTPRTVEILAISEIREEDAKTLFAGIDRKFTF